MLRTKKEIDRHVRELLSKVKTENDRKSRGFNIARMYFSIGEYESARRYLLEFISMQAKSPEAHKLMGQIYEKLGQKDKAVISFKTSYNISSTQKDLVPKICELYADLEVDASIREHWADEGEKLFPHHNSIVKLKQSLMVANPSQSKEEIESFYLREIKANPLSLSLHLKLSKLYLDWAKEDIGKYEEAFNYMMKVEGRRPFPHSLEWYQTMVEVFKAYENWKKSKEDPKFEELFLSVLDRYVFESLASSSGPALSALCSPKEAAQRLQEFDKRLVKSLKILGADSICGCHMIAEFYFNTALLISILSKCESIFHKDIYLGCLLLHAGYIPGKDAWPHSSSSEDSDIVKSQWYNQGHYRVSQAGHMLNQLTHAYRGQKHYLNKIQEMCVNEHTKRHIYNLVFPSSDEGVDSFLLSNTSFMEGRLVFVDQKTQLLCDQSVTLSHSHDLRELVWLYNQYSSPTATDIPGKFFNFHFFRSLPFSASMNTFAPETLSHLDLVAFIVATSYCQRVNADVCEDAVGTSCPSILALYLHTPEQGEWWNAVASLCSNKGGKRLNRLRSILQNGLESVRHMGYHILPVHLSIHLAKYFTNAITEARNEGNSATEIDALEERAEHYWTKVIAYCRKSAKGNFSGSPKSRLFEVRRCELSECELEETSEEGELFLANRLALKGRREEAIQILSRLKRPRAAFFRAMLYKKEAQSLLGNRTWHSLNLSARNEYITLMTQSRDALYLTLDRLKMPGEDPSSSLSQELSEELTRVEQSLATVSFEDFSDDHSEVEGHLAGPTGHGGFNNTLDLTNGNASTPTTPWAGAPSYATLTTNLFSTPTSLSRSQQRQEARPSPERLDAHVRHLTDLQQNTIRNIEEHNAALRAQNEALLQTCQTMSAEFKENVAFYRSYIEQKSADVDHINPIMDQLKQLQTAIKGLHLEVQTLSTEVTELRSARLPPAKPEPLQLVSLATGNGCVGAAAESQVNQVPIELASPVIQGVYNNYMGFYGQQPMVSPLVPPPPIFNPCQPPFMPPSTLQDQTSMLTTSSVNSEATVSPMVQTSVYQPTSLNLKTATSKSADETVASPQGQPPHSYQISLPTITSVSQTMPVISMVTPFTTEGFLSSIPAPLYSAVTTNLSPTKGAARNLSSSGPASASDAPSPITTFAQWQTPNDGVNFPPGPAPLQGHSSPAEKQSPNKNRNDSELYVEDEYDPCPDFKPIVPLPAEVEVQTGEEKEKILFEDRAKLFRFVDKEWKERGLGPMKILHNENENKVRVLMRRDQTHKICCNHLITPNLELTSMADNDKVWVWAAQDFAEEKLTLEKFCCKFKTAEVAQNFQKAFQEGQSIAEAPSDKTAKETNPVKPLSELFKVDPSQWTCDTCLVANSKDHLNCVACKTPKPGDTQTKASKTSPITSVPVSTESKMTFKFGIQSPSTSSSTMLTFLGDKKNVAPTFSFGIPPLSKPAITFGTPTLASSPSVNTTSPFGSGTQLTYGPSSSVTITPLKPGSSPSISLFKTGPTVTSTPITSAEVSSSSNTTIAVSSKLEPGKFSLEGFTFSAEPTLAPPTLNKAGSPMLEPAKVEPKKEPIFSHFSFTSSKPVSEKEPFTINLPASISTPTTSITSSTVTSATSKSPDSFADIFPNCKDADVLTFGSLASAAPTGSSTFTVKDPKAFQPKPIFVTKTTGGLLSSSNSDQKSFDTSKEEADDYEPHVDFKPVIPLPDLVEIKTGEEEEEKLFNERAKLYRYDTEAKEWKERGVGELKLLKNNNNAKVRLLMRRDQTQKVCANHFITSDMKLTPMADLEKAWVWAANDFADEEIKLEKFAIRFKTPELANSFKDTFEAIQKNLDTSTESNTIPVLTKAVPDSSDTSSSTALSLNKPLSELFKPSPGMWECSGCLVMNKPNESKCVACFTPKEGATTASESSNVDTTSVFGGVGFSFKFASKERFTFGVPSTTTSSSTSTGFKTSTTSTATTMTSTSTVTSSTMQPFNLQWNTSTMPAIGETQETGPADASTTPVKTSSSQFTFGSPGKYEFSFSGVKSRSRDTSTCESEGTAAQDEVDEEEDTLYFEPVVPLPDKIEVVTGEEDETVLYSQRSKLYRMNDGKFKERGLGDIKLLEHNQTGKIRLLMRRELVHKICLNHNLTEDMEFRKKDEKSFYWVTTDFSESVPSKETFAIRFKTLEIANGFSEALKMAQIHLAKSPSKVGKPDLAPSSDDARNLTGSEEFEIVYEKRATPDQLQRARNLQLPDNFFLFEDNEPSCPGCIGCSPDDFQFEKPAVSHSGSGSPNIFSQAKSGSLFGAASTSLKFKPANLQLSTAPSFIFGTPSFSTSSAGSLFCRPEAVGSQPDLTFEGSVPNTSQSSESLLGGNQTSSTSSNGAKSSAATTGTSSIFGNQSAGSNSIFGGSAASVFGGQASFTFSSSSPSIFGGSSSSRSLFGRPPVLGAATSSQTIFGAATSSQPVIDATTSSQPVFAVTSSQPVFAVTSSQPVFSVTSSQPVISATTSSQSVFGAATSSQSIFTPASSLQSVFGVTSSQGVFGNKPSLIATATTTTASTLLSGTQVGGQTPVFPNTSEGTSLNSSKSIFGVPFKGSWSSPTTCQTSESQEKPASILSFSDIGKQSSESVLAKTTSSNSAAWVSKPVFSNAADKDSSATGEEEYDPHFEPVIAMPELVEVKTGEEGWEEIFSSRSKVYRYDVPTKEWKERGLGNFKIQFEPKLKKYRFIQRRDQVHKLACNHYLTSTLELLPLESSESALCWFATDFSDNPDGEFINFGVKFKTKEICDQFNLAFDACKSKIAELEAFNATSSSSPPSAGEGTLVSPDIKKVGQDEDCGSSSAVYANPDNEYEDVSGSDGRDDDFKDTEEDDDDKGQAMFIGDCNLSMKKDKNWESLGSTHLRIIYDDDAYGGRIVGVSEKGDTLVNSLISIQTTYSVHSSHVCFASMDERCEPPKKVELKASFKSQDMAGMFADTLGQGKDFAHSSGIQEAFRNEVPSDVLYFSQTNEGSSSERIRSCDPKLTSTLNEILGSSR